MRIPPFLGPGDRVALIAPAGAVSQEEAVRATRRVEALGWTPVVYGVGASLRGYLAGEDQARADAFLRAWHAPDVHGIIALRGGYGTPRILPLLPPTLMGQVKMR